MTAEELLKAGHLLAAVEQLNQEVRARPTDIQRRTVLFELLCFAGDWQRADLVDLTEQRGSQDGLYWWCTARSPLPGRNGIWQE